MECRKREQGLSAGLWPQGLGASEQSRWSVACWAKVVAVVDCVQHGPGMAEKLSDVGQQLVETWTLHGCVQER